MLNLADLCVKRFDRGVVLFRGKVYPKSSLIDETSLLFIDK